MFAADVLIISHPIAFARFWPCKYSAVMDNVIGVIRAAPMPFNEKKKIRVKKLVENEHVIADNACNIKPMANSFVWLYFTLSKLTMNDAISITSEFTALICPTMPTCNPKVIPISISARVRLFLS